MARFGESSLLEGTQYGASDSLGRGVVVALSSRASLAIGNESVLDAARFAARQVHVEPEQLFLRRYAALRAIQQFLGVQIDATHVASSHSSAHLESDSTRLRSASLASRSRL